MGSRPCTQPQEDASQDIRLDAEDLLYGLYAEGTHDNSPSAALMPDNMSGPNTSRRMHAQKAEQEVAGEAI